MMDNASQNLAGYISNLGKMLGAEFQQNARLREPFEQSWLRDLRQYKGKYDPEIEARIGKNRSKAFLRLTTIKVNTMLANAFEFLFPSGKRDNWKIDPTDRPDTPAGEGLGPEEERQLRESCRIACDAMARTMRDQLGGGGNRPSYKSECKKVLRSGLLYGLGALKGPLLFKRERQQWQSVNDRWELATVVSNENHPHYEFVPIWNIYPDMTCGSLHQMRFIWQTHLMGQQDLLDLCRVPGFDADAIRAFIKELPRGDATVANWERELRSIADDQQNVDMEHRYRVYERWGYLTGAELQEVGVPVDQDLHQVYMSNVWMLGDSSATLVIKAVLSPFRGVVWPYHFFRVNEDETSFFGEGVPSLMRDQQQAACASFRTILDNAAISSGPLIGINTRMLAPGQDPTDLHPWKIFLFEKGNIGDALQVAQVTNNSNELVQILKLAMDFADDLTIPRYASGDSKAKGAAQTARGLSMLMAGASVNLKQIVKGFDEGVTGPFITSLYHWNMQFNPRQDIKGDFGVKATGSAALTKKEVLSQMLLQFAQLSADERFHGRVKDGELFQEIANCMDIPEHTIRDDNEYAQWEQQQRMQAAMAQVQAIIAEAQERDIDIRQALAEMMMQAQQNAGVAGVPAPANDATEAVF